MASYTHQRKLAERKERKRLRKADFNYMRSLQLKLEARPKPIVSGPEPKRVPRVRPLCGAKLANGDEVLISGWLSARNRKKIVNQLNKEA